MFLLKTDGELRAIEKGTHAVWQTEIWKGEGGKKKKASTLISRIKSHLHMKSYWHNTPSKSCCSPGRHMHKRLSVLNTAKWDVPLTPPLRKRFIFHSRKM